MLGCTSWLEPMTTTGVNWLSSPVLFLEASTPIVSSLPAHLKHHSMTIQSNVVQAPLCPYIFRILANRTQLERIVTGVCVSETRRKSNGIRSKLGLLQLCPAEWRVGMDGCFQYALCLAPMEKSRSRSQEITCPLWSLIRGILYAEVL